MARAIWSGSISFGLVNIPVKAYSAVRDHTIHFHQLQKGTGARIRNKRVSEKSGREVDSDDIELGYELPSGNHVTVDPNELDDLRPRTTKSIDIEDFVSLVDIDPIYYERTYWLAPGDDSATRPYQLLLHALEDQARVGIGSVVMRRKQYLGAIRPLDGALALSTMRFADEVIGRKDVDALPSRRSAPKPKELQLAANIIDSLAADWNPKRYHDTYTDDVRKIIKKRSAGKHVKPEAPVEPVGGQVVDLMEALEASVAKTKADRKKSGTKSRKRTTSRSRKSA